MKIYVVMSRSILSHERPYFIVRIFEDRNRAISYAKRLWDESDIADAVYSIDVYETKTGDYVETIGSLPEEEENYSGGENVMHEFASRIGGKH